ncbi:MAG: hypothetical protein N3A38_16375 [Planctomycetota bacterium]|nr:hypothetical protein [Planctomycetota bacterium]
MTRIVQIYMPLLGENVDVWRPVQAEHLYDNIYRILDKPPDLDGESWEFAPGDEVVCEVIEVADGPILAAIRKVERI